MKTILKYRLDASDNDTSLTLTDGFRVVRTEYIPAENRVHLWVEIPLKAGTPESRVEFRVIASGQPIGDDFGYVGTALDTHAPEAYHVFIRFAGQKGARPPASASESSPQNQPPSLRLASNSNCNRTSSPTSSSAIP